jgi:hypothetical protein
MTVSKVSMVVGKENVCKKLRPFENPMPREYNGMEVHL